MRICIDFDGTIVTEKPWDYDGPLEFMPGAREGLQALKRAGHYLILFSSRANKANRFDWQLNPENRLKPNFSLQRWLVKQKVHARRYNVMLWFVEKELPEIFDYIDEGTQGKPDADLFIDDRGCRLNSDGLGVQWPRLIELLGESEGT